MKQFTILGLEYIGFTMFLGLTRPKSAVNRTKPIPIITKGQGGSSASLAPKIGRTISTPGRTDIFREVP